MTVTGIIRNRPIYYDTITRVWRYKDTDNKAARMKNIKPRQRTYKMLIDVMGIGIRTIESAYADLESGNYIRPKNRIG